MEKAILIAAEPQLFVSDIKASCDFFTLKLGFKVAFVFGEPPSYAQVFRDGARLNLRSVDTPLVDLQLRDRESFLCASMTLASAEEIERLFAEMKSAGAVFHQALKTESWGSRTFIVKDPDGNLLLFSAPPNDSSERA
jgi:catechol 2,3-dioxygenase-like lactoylglutathione lyase family enzyme